MNIKRFFCLATAVLTVCGGLLFSRAAHSVRAETVPAVILDGVALTFDVPPQIINDRVMLPFRTIAEAMGAVVGWRPEYQKIFVYLDDRYVEMTVGNPTMLYGAFSLGESGEGIYDTINKYEMDSPPIIVNDRTLIPVRAMAEALGAEVKWDPEAVTVTISTNPSAEDEKEIIPTATPSALEIQGKLIPENIIIEPDAENPNLVQVTLNGFSVPERFIVNKPETEDGAMDVMLSVEFSFDGKNSFRVASFNEKQAGSRQKNVYIKNLECKAGQVTSDYSNYSDKMSANIVDYTEDSVTWQLEMPGDMGIDINKITNVGYWVKFGEDVDSCRSYAKVKHGWDDLGKTLLADYFKGLMPGLTMTYELNRVKIEVDKENPRRATATLSGFKLPEGSDIYQRYYDRWFGQVNHFLGTVYADASFFIAFSSNDGVDGGYVFCLSYSRHTTTHSIPVNYTIITRNDDLSFSYSNEVSNNIKPVLKVNLIGFDDEGENITFNFEIPKNLDCELRQLKYISVTGYCTGAFKFTHSYKYENKKWIQQKEPLPYEDIVESLLSDISLDLYRKARNKYISS